MPDDRDIGFQVDLASDAHGLGMLTIRRFAVADVLDDGAALAVPGGSNLTRRTLAVWWKVMKSARSLGTPPIFFNVKRSFPLAISLSA